MKLKTLAEQNNYTCFYCKEKFPLDQLTRDHWNPAVKSEGDYRKSLSCLGTGKRRRGSKGEGDNIVLACNMCNLNKGNKSPYLFKLICKR